jgi:hypothetical protein
MSEDRTKPPPHVTVGPLESIVSAADGEEWYRYPAVERGPGKWCDSPESAIEALWADYDRITLPARVALLRELAESVGISWGRPPPDDPMVPEWRAGFRMAVEVIENEMKARADQLEKGAPT